MDVHRTRVNFPRKPFVLRCSLSPSLPSNPRPSSRLPRLPCPCLVRCDTDAPEAARPPKQAVRWRAHPGSTWSPHTRQRARCTFPLPPLPLLPPFTPPTHRPQSRLMVAQERLRRHHRGPSSPMDRAYSVHPTLSLSITFLQTHTVPHYCRLRRGQCLLLVCSVFRISVCVVLPHTGHLLDLPDRVRAMLFFRSQSAYLFYPRLNVVLFGSRLDLIC